MTRRTASRIVNAIALPKFCPTPLAQRGFTVTSGESALIEFRLSFHVVGSQGRAPLEGFANAVRRVRIPPFPLNSEIQITGFRMPSFRHCTTGNTQW